MAKAEEGITWTSKQDDFFPYRDCDSCNWAGYYTSRPSCKLMERQASRLGQIVRQMDSWSKTKTQAGTKEATLRGSKKESENVLFELTSSMGVVNHHDALTGTAKQHVNNDWLQTLDSAIQKSEQYVGNVVHQITDNGHDNKLNSYASCRAMNESLCFNSQSLRPGHSMLVSVYNGLAREQSDMVRVVLETGHDVVVHKVDGEGEEIASQVIPISATSRCTKDCTLSTDSVKHSGNFNLYFYAKNIAPLGYTTYTVTMSESETKVKMMETERKEDNKMRSDDNIVTIENSEIRVAFDTQTGALSSVTRLDSSSTTTLPLALDLAYYKSFQGPPTLSDSRDPHQQNLNPPAFATKVEVNERGEKVGSSSDQPSGAYIFRTSESHEQPTPIRFSKEENKKAGKILRGPSAFTSTPKIVSVTQGDLVSEVVQEFSSWATLVTRIKAGSPLIEFEWTLGEIPINEPIAQGKEVIAKFTSSMMNTDSDCSTSNSKSSPTLIYTDSNSREFMPRCRDDETAEFVAGNYYPLSSAAYIVDKEQGLQMSILTDRGEGAASLEQGSIEVMLQRRLVQDDWRGVGEPLNETTLGITPYPDWVREGKGITVRGSVAVLVSEIDKGMKELRTHMDKMYLPIYPLYSTPTTTTTNTNTASTKLGLTTSLPENIHLQTLEVWTSKPNTLLVRLAHQFAIDEDKVLSQPVMVDMGLLLEPWAPISLTEMSLSANMEKTEMMSRRIDWSFTVDSDSHSHSITANKNVPYETMQKKGKEIKKASKSDMMVYMEPMEIKTFLVEISAEKEKIE